MKKNNAPEISQEQLAQITQSLKPILDKKLERAKELVAKIEAKAMKV
jgi:hypothetical protein